VHVVPAPQPIKKLLREVGVALKKKKKRRRRR